MKRHGNLWNIIISEDNIRTGVINACNSKSRKTPFKKRNIYYTKNHVEETVKRIKALFEHGFQTSQYYVYPLFDPKLRFIYCLPFYPDRIVHHCILNVLAPIWDRLMYSCSYACRTGYGQHKAGTLCGIYAKKYAYCAQFDVSQFYVNINHDILKKIVRHKIKDKALLLTLDEIIDSVNTRKKNLEILYHMRDRGRKCKDIPIEIRKLEYAVSIDDTGSEVGLPMGNYTSQWLGNLYLNELDTFVKQKLRAKAYVRYCDDFLIFGDDKTVLHRIVNKIQKFLWRHLRMTLSKKEVFQTKQGVDFVGYRYFHSGLILLRKRTARNQKLTIAHIREHMKNGTLNVTKAKGQLGSMHGLLKWAKTYNFRKSQGLDELIKDVNNLGMI